MFGYSVHQFIDRRFDDGACRVDTVTALNDDRGESVGMGRVVDEADEPRSSLLILADLGGAWLGAERETREINPAPCVSFCRAAHQLLDL